MKSIVRLAAFIGCGLLVFPATSFASCTSTLVSTANVASSNSRLIAVGGSSASDVWAVGASCPSGSSCASQTLIEHSAGSTWTVVPSPNYPGSISDQLNGVTAVSPTEAWAVGSWSGIRRADADRELIEHWDGSEWTTLSNHGSEELDGISSVPGDSTSVWAVGFSVQPNCRVPAGCAAPVAEHWNVARSRWDQTSVPSGPIGVATLSAAISLPGGSVWAAGEAELQDFDSTPMLVHWTGTSWITVPNAVERGLLTAIAASSDTDVWVAGVVLRFDQVAHHFVEHWNGSGWTVYKFQTFEDASLDAISEGSSAADVWIAGGFRPTSSTNAGLPLLEHFDGTSWSVIPTPADGMDSASVALYRTTAGVLSVGFALPALNYDVITFGTLSHC